MNAPLIPVNVGGTLFRIPKSPAPPLPDVFEAMALSLLEQVPFYKAAGMADQFVAYRRGLEYIMLFRTGFQSLINRLHWVSRPAAEREVFPLTIEEPRHIGTFETGALSLAEATSAFAADLVLRARITAGKLEAGLEWLAERRGGGTMRWASDISCQLKFRRRRVLETLDIIEAKQWVPEPGWRPCSERVQFAWQLVPKSLRTSVRVLSGSLVCQAEFKETGTKTWACHDILCCRKTSALLLSGYVLAMPGPGELWMWNNQQKQSPPASTI